MYIRGLGAAHAAGLLGGLPQLCYTDGLDVDGWHLMNQRRNGAGK